MVAENGDNYSYNGNPFYLLPNVESTDYTDSVSDRYIFAAASAGLTFTETETSELEYQVLLTTTENSVSKTTTDNITTSEYEEGDINGPFNIALAVNQEVGEETTRLVVFGTPLLLSDEADSVVSGNNSTMFADIMGMFVGETELASSVIPVKEMILSNLTISTAFATAFGLVMTIVLPIFLIVYGIAIWGMRRKK